MKYSHLLFTTLLASAISFHALAADSSGSQSSSRTATTANEKTTDKEVRKEVGEAVDSIKAYSVDKRDEAIKKSKDALADFDARMEQLEQRMKDTKDKTIVELRIERAEVAKRYENMKSSTKETWEETKAAFIKSYHDLEDNFKKADETTPASKQKD